MRSKEREKSYVQMFYAIFTFNMAGITSLTDHVVNFKVLVASQRMVRGPSGTKCGLTGFNAVSYCRRNVDIDNDFETGCTDCNSLCSYKTAHGVVGYFKVYTYCTMADH